MERKLPGLVRDTKLEIIVSQTHTLQVEYVSNPATGERRTRVEERWETTQDLGRGAFGQVWLEKCTAGPSPGRVRAVKAIMKGPGVEQQTDYTRELEAIAKFSQLRVRTVGVQRFPVKLPAVWMAEMGR
jgi:hypothetical protein